MRFNASSSQAAWAKGSWTDIIWRRSPPASLLINSNFYLTISCSFRAQKKLDSIAGVILLRRTRIKARKLWHTITS